MQLINALTLADKPEWRCYEKTAAFIIKDFNRYPLFFKGIKIKKFLELFVCELITQPEDHHEKT